MHITLHHTTLTFDLDDSQPLTVGVTKSVFQFISGSVAIYYMYWAYADIMEVVTSSTLWASPRAVLFTILGLRDPLLQPSMGSSVIFGLMHNGCPIEPVANTSNGSAMISLSQRSVSPNGYFLQIASWGLAANDTVQWRVDLQSEEGDMWRTVGASVWRGYGTLAKFFPRLAYPVPESSSAVENVLIRVDMRPSWPWILTEVGTYAVAGLGWGICCLSGMTGRQRAARPAVSILFGVNSLLQAAAAAGYGSAGDWRASVEGWMNGAAAIVMSVALLVDEQLIVPAFFIFGIICLLTLVCLFSLPAIPSIPTHASFIVTVYCTVNSMASALICCISDSGLLLLTQCHSEF